MLNKKVVYAVTLYSIIFRHPTKNISYHEGKMEQ